MRKALFFILIFTLFACQNNNYKIAVVENDNVNQKFLQKANNPEKALISMYLFAYGNECRENTSSIKCKILKSLNIDNECNAKHIEFLKQWFATNKLMLIKLQNCPNLPHNFAIQNQIKKIEIIKQNDTLTIIFNVKGVNESQEKTWDITQEKSYIIKNKTLVKI